MYILTLLLWNATLWAYVNSKKANRYVSATKKDAAQSSQSVATFHLVRNSRQTIHSLLQRFPLTTKERQELQQRLERNQYNEGLPASLLLTNNYINMQRLVCHVSVMKERMWLSPASNASLYFLFAFCVMSS